jgi:hypothetical protein
VSVSCLQVICNCVLIFPPSLLHATVFTHLYIHSPLAVIDVRSVITVLTGVVYEQCA